MTLVNPQGQAIGTVEIGESGDRRAFQQVKLRKLHRRDVPMEWEQRLAEYSPPTNRFTWLKLIWEPGYPWETPVDRFIIYQMTPRIAIEPYVLEQLEDYPPPSKMGNYYDTVKQEFIRDPDCLITERAWHLYKETKAWGRPFWVIQGKNGGHKRWFSQVEQNFLKLAGLPQDPPVPGALEYAEFDDKVMAMLQRHDFLKGVKGTLKTRKGLMQGIMDEHLAEQEKQLRIDLVKWLADQVTEASEGVMESLMVLDAPRADFDVKTMEERSERAIENYIETGKSHGGALLR